MPSPNTPFNVWGKSPSQGVAAMVAGGLGGALGAGLGGGAFSSAMLSPLCSNSTHNISDNKVSNSSTGRSGIPLLLSAKPQRANNATPAVRHTSGSGYPCVFKALIGYGCRPPGHRKTSRNFSVTGFYNFFKSLKSQELC